MVTAELAAALPVLVAVVLVGVGLLAAASATLRCEDAARLAARSVARGDDPAASASLARTAAPPGAVVRLLPMQPADGGSLVGVRVSEQVRVPGPLGRALPSWTVSGTAVALAEGR